MGGLQIEVEVDLLLIEVDLFLVRGFVFRSADGAGGGSQSVLAAGGLE